MEKELPKNWVQCSLGEIIQTKKGKKPSSTIDYPKEGYIPYILIDEMEGKPIRSYTNDTKVSIVNKDEVLLVWDGSIGKCGSGLAGAIGSTLVALKPLSNIPTKFIEYIIIDKNSFIKQTSTGTGLQHINKDFFKDCRIGLPPLTEQNRIVAKLDVLFSQMETIKKSMTNVPLLLKDFRQQVLTKAVTSKLTEEWRKEKKLAAWEEIPLNDICSSITDGDHQAPPQVNEGIPFLVISNVSKGYFEFDKVSRFVPREYYNSLKYTRKPKPGDVLYTVTGSYGIPLLVDFEKEFCFQRHIAILRPDDTKVLSKFLKILLQSNLILSQAHSVATGTAQLTVPLGGIKKFEVNLPSIIEQQEIVSRVESLFVKADAIEKQYESLKGKIDNLPQALLHKAFKGELTEQLDSDGDARELLRQIQELRASTGKTVKSKSKTPTKKVKPYVERDEVLGMVAEG